MIAAAKPGETGGPMSEPDEVHRGFHRPVVHRTGKGQRREQVVSRSRAGRELRFGRFYASGIRAEASPDHLHQQRGRLFMLTY